MPLQLEQYIGTIPDFPKKGILYRDIQPLLTHPEAFAEAVKQMGKLTSEVPDYWVGIESRGFIFATALSMQLGGGIKLIRKKNKLPNPDLLSASYGLEYGTDTLEMARDESLANKTVVIVDDLLATGGTMDAAKSLCDQNQLRVADRIVLIDLQIISGSDIKSVITYGH